MTSNIVAVVAVVIALGALVVSVLQTHNLNNTLDVVTYNGATELTLQLDHIFIEYPELRPFFYDNAELDDSDILLCQRARAAAEFALDVLECIWDHRDKYEPDDRSGWRTWINDFVATSPVMRELYETNIDWYPALQDALRRTT